MRFIYSAVCSWPHAKIGLGLSAAMSLLLLSGPATLTNCVPRISLSNRRPQSKLLCVGASPTMCLEKSFDSSFHLTNPIPFLTISAMFACVRGFLAILPSDFSDRWSNLAELSRDSEKKVKSLPYHLIQAVLSSEDRRFFYHFGFDPYGVGRAVVFYPNGGGGSTITQQLVKNIFLTNERKISRKVVEGILSLILETRFSKWEILYAYFCKMYWGHGNFGIDAASLFYFGKLPTMLNVGESALLAGILPGPEVLNPFTNPKRGKYAQARALRRMVAAGFLDLDKALNIVSQPLFLANNHGSQVVKV